MIGLKDLDMKLRKEKKQWSILWLDI